jgi:hypothetical protein
VSETRKTNEPDIATLLGEAQTLRTLLRRYQSDRNFLQENGTVLVNFIDAHDVTAFINPDKENALRGFALEAEARQTNPATAFDLRLKSDELLRQILFTGQVGLLPSHGEELDEEVAFQRWRQMTDRLSTLAAARRQLMELSRGAIATGLIERVYDADEKTRSHILTFLSERAPALMALLNPQPDTPPQRIDSLFERSGLVGLPEFAWEAYDIAPRDAEQLRRSRPTPSRTQRWCDYLSTRGLRSKNSNRANRVDAEAIAYVEELNGQLQAITGGLISARLVTRAMTLLVTTLKVEDPEFDDLRTPDFLRHPRLTVLPSETGVAASTGAMSNSAATLGIALKTFIRQVRMRDPTSAPDANLRQVFVDAWHGFESARLTRELHLNVTARNPDDPALEETYFPKLLRWLADRKEFDELIESETNKCIRQFGSATFSLIQTHDSEPVEARIVKLLSPPRTIVRPFMSGVPGPVEFASRSLDLPEGVRTDIEADLTNAVLELPAEQYLAWALVHACRNRWRLAAIYARAAADVAAVDSSSGQMNVSKEAQLVHAQVRRLGVLESEHPFAAHDRFQEVERRLSFPGASDDPRMLHERAAQLIELALVSANQTGEPISLAPGIVMLQRAESLAGRNGDTLTQGRCLSMLLIYVLAILRRDLEWPADCGDMRETATAWHDSLLVLLHKDVHQDEIPRRTRAMRIAGYLMFGSANTPNDDLPARFQRTLPKYRPVPAEYEAAAAELHEQIVRGNDQVAALIATELDRVVGSGRYKGWALVHAPIWATYLGDSILTDIRDPDVYGLARPAYDILRHVAGPEQFGLDIANRRSYRRASTLLEKTLALIDRIGRGASTERAVFYLRMDLCYSRWITAMVTRDQAERKSTLATLLTHYAELCELFPQAAIPHFRRHLILSEFADGDSSSVSLPLQRDEQLDLALRKASEDPFLAELPHHWVLSTMIRRKAYFTLKPAFELKSNVDTASRSGAVTDLLSTLRRAFALVWRDFDVSLYKLAGGFYALERECRINNIAFYAAVYLGLTGDLRKLAEPEFTREQLRSLLRALYPEDIAKVTDIEIVHTIGYGYYVLNDFDRAVQAAHRLAFLLVDRGIDPSNDQELSSLFSDAVTWRRHAPRNVAARGA